jgi:hypothetical protein
MMKIAHITSVHSWNDTRIYHKMCRSLAQAGHEVHLVAARGPELPKESFSGVRIRRIAPLSNRLERMSRTTWAVLSLAESLHADIYHFHDPEFLPWSVRFQSRVKVPVIYDAHEDYRVHMAKAWLPKWLQGLAALLVGHFEDTAVHRLAGVISATPHIARRFTDHPHSAVVQNFPILEEFASVPLAGERRRGAFAYVGGISRARGIEEMIRALPLAGPEACLHLAGPWSSQSTKESCSRLEGWNRVEGLGVLNRSAVGRLLANVQGGLVVLHGVDNYLNSYPVKLFEYMAAGIPVIASDFPLWRRIVKGAGCGLLVDPLDPQAIADAMRWIMDHPEEAEAMGRRGRKAVEETYNWESEAKKLLGLYETLLDKQTEIFSS